MEDKLPDHVQDYKLETRFPRKREIVHIYNDTDAPPSSQRRLEYWKSEKRPIGRGGQGRVFLQTCTSGGRHYTHRAVKIIPLQSGGGGRRRYIRELETIVKFSHDKYSKYFVKSLGWYEKNDSLCIAMEYVPAGDLQTYLCEYPALPEDNSRQIISQVLQGLEIMHGEGFAHRDIKPQNILIYQRPTPTEPGSCWVKLSDFGISKRLQAATCDASTVIGTQEYMAPELLSHLPYINYPAADMWALGVMTFWMLTKSDMFPNQWYVFQYAENPERLFPRDLLGDCNISLDGQAFIHALMRPKPHERPDCNAASHHAWVQPWIPSAPEIPDNHSESSILSSARSSLNEERGMTTQVSNITDLSNAAQTGLSPQPTDIPQELLNEIQAQLLPAAEMGDEAEVKLLLERGADIEAEDGNRRTPLLLAAWKGHEAVVKVLLEKGAHLEAKDGNGWTPLFWANGNEAMVKMLLEKHADLEAKDNYNQTPLLLAAWSGHVAAVKLLLEKGANLEAKDKHGQTPLLLAAWNGHKEVVKLLLEKGSDLEAKDNYDQTPLSGASRSGHEAVVELLLEKGANQETKDNCNQTPLLRAARSGHKAVVTVLLEKGADLEAKDRDGWTPLSRAARNGHETVVKLLLTKGIDLKTKDSSCSDLVSF